MDKPVVAQKSPIVIDVEEGKNYFWCACGLSKNQPFCDGSHSTTAFTPVQWTATETGKQWFCACKATGNQPLCDGTHKTI